MVVARKAWASFARVTQRWQDVQRLTWCSSSPAGPLAAWSVSVDGLPAPGRLHQRGKQNRRGRAAATEGEFATVAVAANKGTAVTGPAVGNVGQGPVAESVPRGTGAGGATACSATHEVRRPSRSRVVLT